MTLTTELSGVDTRRLWLGVLHQAAKDAQSSNGVREDARGFLLGGRGEWILQELGWSSRRARRAVERVAEHGLADDLDGP